MARTLDKVILDTLGLKEMTIARIVWENEDLKEKLANSQALLIEAAEREKQKEP